MNIVSTLFIIALISIFSTGILMLLVLTKRNRLQLTLAGILTVFLVMMLIAIINVTQSPDHIHQVLSSPFRFRFLALGLIAFFATMAYYMVAAHRNLLTVRNGLLFLSPVLLTLLVYVLWHWRTGVPMDYAYASLAEVWEKRFSIPVILRVLMYLFFLIYQGVMIRNMWHLDSMRSKHSILNSPDAVSNIRWLRMVVLGMMAILVMYSLLVFIPSISVFAIYSVVLASVFIYFIYNALARPMYEDTKEWQAVWSMRDGWKIIRGESKSKPMKTVIEPDVVVQTDPTQPLESEKTDDRQPVDEPDYLILIDQWMKKNKPFCHADFSSADIITQFPDLDKKFLNDLLQKEGHLQAYIRRHRIEEACCIIRREKEIKVAELALRIGFSHTSSFSRAFSTVMGETVLQYMNKVGAKRKTKKKNN